MAQSSLLSQINQNGVQHDFLGHVMPVLALHNTDAIINATTAFIRSRKSKQGATCLFHHVMPLAPALTSHDTDIIINSTIAFVRSR